MNLQRLAKKYRVSTNDFDCVYYDVFNKIKKFNENFEDLFGKYLFDRLEEFDMESKDIDNLVEHYTSIMQEYCDKKSSIVNKMLDGESTETVMDEDMQTTTSGSVDAITNGRRKAGYKVVHQDEYDENFEDL